MKRYDAQRQRWVDDAEGDATAAAARTRRMQRVTILSAAGVLLVSSLGFGLWRAVENGLERDRAERAAARAEASASAQASPEADPGASPDAGNSPPSGGPSGTTPDGYERVEDEEGWSLDVPEGWTRKVVAGEGRTTVVDYESGDGAHSLRVFWVEDSSPYESARLADRFLKDEATAYQRIGLDRLPADGAANNDTARLEYAYEDKKSGERRRTVDERFEAADGEFYAVAGTGPEDDDTVREFTAAGVSSFCPAAGDC